MDLSLLKLETRKRKRETFSCIICQTDTDEPTRNASSKGVTSFLDALHSRVEAGDSDTKRYFDSIVETSSCGLKLSDPNNELIWHKTCYSSFTSKHHISRLNPQSQASDSQGPSCSKVQRRSFNWKELCFFCEKKSYKKNKKLFNVATFEFCKTLESRAKERSDAQLDCKVGDYNKLIANEAKYHKECHSKYIKQESSSIGSENVYNIALENLISDIQPGLKAGKAFLMTDLLDKYHKLLSRYVPLEEAKKYRSHKLKAKLESKYGNKLQILTSQQQGNPDIFIDKDLKIGDAINYAANLKEALNMSKEEADLLGNNEPTPQMILFHAALLLRSMKNDCTGIEVQPLEPSLINIEKEEEIVPQELYSFIAWILLAEEDVKPETPDKTYMKKKCPSLHQKVLSICQDIIYIGSRGKCKTPKHIGLGFALHQLTQSREAISLVNKNGHSISYTELERIDTCWANTLMHETEVPVPANMTPGVTIRAAGDNFNRATESLDGKHLDIMNMVMYQVDSNNNPLGHFGPNQRNDNCRPPEKKQTSEILECPNMAKKQPGPLHLVGKTNLQWFFSCSEEHKDERALDNIFTELRMMPTKLFEMDIDRLETQLPGLTVFHAKVSQKPRNSKTKIGYCPMIPASATEYNTIYTMMKTFQGMFQTLGQNWTYVTYDEAIYSKAQLIKWRNMDEFQNDELEMGGMHRAMNFMGDIGKIMEESGVEDILVEGNVYGPCVVQQILKGKSYNRGMRAHKLLNESMNRLKRKAFEKWLEENEIEISPDEKGLIVSDVEKLRQLLQENQTEDEGDELESTMRALRQHMSKLHNLMVDFTAEGRSSSYTFQFWDNYVAELSQLLLDYVAAKRDGNRELELETFAEMLPYDFACGHTNYARWGTVNVIEGHLIKQTKPEIHEAISNDHAAVYRSEKPFSGVWHDMAIEQSLNRECGKLKQLYANEGALQKYFLTAHHKAEVAENMKRMSGCVSLVNDTHKEASKHRTDKDERAVQKLVTVVEDRMVNPFEVEIGATAEDKQPLVNIATSVVATPDVQEQLCNVLDVGQTRLNTFIQDRLHENKTEFMAPIHKQTVKTFSSMNKPMKVKKAKKVESVNVDRQIFSKLTVIAQSRDVDVRNLMQYELSSIPLALFNLDGSMRKTTKSAVLSWMEGDDAMKELPPDEDPQMLVIDLMMLLRMLCTEKTDCKTFGDLSDKVLNIILSMGYKFTAVVGDNYQNDQSIKAGERARRGGVQMQEIRNPSKETPLPLQKQKYLSNPANKLNLANFVLTDICEKCVDVLPENRTVFLGGGFRDSKKAVKIQKDTCVREEELESDHEEADSRLFLHVDYAVNHLDVNSVVIWSQDTDVAAMCPMFSRLLGIKVFLRTGVRDKRRYIAMHDVASELGESMTMALPAVHSISGCDSTSAFSGVGKKKWITTLLKNPSLLEGLMEIGNTPIQVTEKAAVSTIKTVSLLYCGKEHGSTDEVRYELFAKKGFSSEKLPPTSDALNLHLKRANYQAHIWKSATQQYLNLPPPLDAGWMIEDGNLVPVKMTKPPAPEALLDFTKCSCKTDCLSRRCSCRKESIWCSDACMCDSENCLNRPEHFLYSESDEDD